MQENILSKKLNLGLNPEWRSYQSFTYGVYDIMSNCICDVIILKVRVAAMRQCEEVTVILRKVYNAHSN